MQCCGYFKSSCGHTIEWNELTKNLYFSSQENPGKTITEINALVLAFLEMPNKNPWTVLWTCTKYEEISCLHLKEHASLQDACVEQIEPLRLKVKSFLSEAQKTINAPSATQVALAQAVHDQQHDFVKEHLAKGESPNGIDKQGWPYLYIAVSKGDEKMVNILLDCKADINMRTPHHSTALHIAAIKGYGSLVRVLLEWGADPTLKDECGTLPHAWAKASGHFGIMNLLKISLS